MKKDSSWIRNGIWNTAEHASTRILDAVATLIILWSVPTEKFSHLALAQAWVAPALLIFIAPETILYRDFSKWEAEGRGVLLTRVRMLRRFAWGKMGAGLLLSFAIAAFAGSGSFSERFYALIWAFALPLAPQFAGPDREFLRIDLRLRELNFVTLFQRVFYLVLLFVAIRFFRSSMIALASAAGIAVVVTAGICRFLVERGFRETQAVVRAEDSFSKVISNSFTGFSIWNHIAGIVIGWMQTMDLFFLGVFGFAPLEIGLYSTVLKLANFSLAAPMAFSNLYAVHLGRADPQLGETERKGEWDRMLRLSGALIVFVVVQGLIFRLGAPWLLSVLSRNRWSETDMVRMTGWLNWLIPSCALFGSLLLWTAWLNVRTSIRDLVIRTYVPWGILALSGYALFIRSGGADGAAKANLFVVIFLVPLLFFATHRSGRFDAWKKAQKSSSQGIGV